MTDSLFTNLHHLLAAAWRRRYLIATCTLLMPLLGLMVSLLAPRHWETHTTLLVQDTAKLNPFLEDLSVGTQLEDRMGGLNALLHSRHMLMGIGEELGLLDASSSDEERERLVARLSAELSVRLLGKDLIQLSYRSGSPDRLAETLLAVRKRFLGFLLAPQQSSLQASERFLHEQLGQRRRELEEAERKLAEFKQQHAGELPDLLGANVGRQRELHEAIASRETELAGAKGTYASLESRLVQVNPVIARLEEQIVGLTSELAMLRARYTDDHSAVQAVKRKLERLEEERRNQLKASSGLAKADVERLWDLAGTLGESGGGNTEHGQALLISQLQELQSAKNRVQSLEEELAKLRTLAGGVDAQLARSGDVERVLAELERDLAARRELYADLQLRYEKARVTGALGQFEEPERIKIIDEPFTPGRPSNLPTLLFVLAGLAGGIALGTGLAVIAELGDTTLRRRDRLEALLGVPLLSRIPKFVPGP